VARTPLGVLPVLQLSGHLGDGLTAGRDDLTPVLGVGRLPDFRDPGGDQELEGLGVGAGVGEQPLRDGKSLGHREHGDLRPLELLIGLGLGVDVGAGDENADLLALAVGVNVGLFGRCAGRPSLGGGVPIGAGSVLRRQNAGRDELPRGIAVLAAQHTGLGGNLKPLRRAHALAVGSHRPDQRDHLRQRVTVTAGVATGAPDRAVVDPRLPLVSLLAAPPHPHRRAREHLVRGAVGVAGEMPLCGDLGERGG